MSDVRTLLRWLAVIPAAILAGWIAKFVFGFVSVAVMRAISEPAPSYTALALYYAPKTAAFVIAGAKIAPRQLATALVLAAAVISVSLMVHILGQSRVGLTNYLHFIAESTGALLSVAYIYMASRAIRATNGEKTTAA